MKSPLNRDYVLSCVRSVRAGGDTVRRRGEVAVYEDQTTYFYEQRYIHSARDFKAWVRGAFDRNDGTSRVSGRWPDYSVERC